MHASSERQDNLFSIDPSLRKPFIISIIFHLLVIVGFTVGLPIIKPPPTDFTPISVELLPIDKLTQTNKVAAPKKVDETKPEQKPPESKIKPPEMKETKPEEVKPPTPPEPVETVKKPDEPKPPEPKKEEKKPAEPKKPAPEKPKEEPKQEEDFNSLLKNLTPVTPDLTEASTDKTETTPEKTADAPLSDRLTMSEEDALRHQLGQCWNVPAGAKDAEELFVEIRVTMNPDRTVQQAIILDQGRYNLDPVFRAAADAARRAFQNPRCIPLELPEDGYEQWKTMTIRFDPKNML